VNAFDQSIVDSVISHYGVASKPLCLCMQSTLWRKF